MLHPVAVSYGKKWCRDRSEMPLLRGQDLMSPVAAWRVAARQFEAEQARVIELTATIARIEADLAHTNSCLAAASESFSVSRGVSSHAIAMVLTDNDDSKIARGSARSTNRAEPEPNAVHEIA
jgi:hypothetical protein